MQKEMQEFLGANKVATICYVNEGLPWCFNCLYAVLPGGEGIVFKSSGTSKHSTVMQHETPVAGTIYNASKRGLDNSGVQFSGIVTMDTRTIEIAEKAYYKRYPIGLLIPGRLFVITFTGMKLTQSSNGIKRKMHWEHAGATES